MSTKTAGEGDEKSLRGQLADVRKAAAAQFGESNPDRVAQLDAALATADMAIGHLFTETPYRPTGA